jgi:hypothetical protein
MGYSELVLSTRVKHPTHGTYCFAILSSIERVRRVVKADSVWGRRDVSVPSRAGEMNSGCGRASS